eukprot:TRINITY_DN11928_c0_g1_i1.p2 TRINITY_DN11928_c0_g1~~TRINITY_DN11928_c0_g1_i1.p2  ORF type:complete len:194 (+),score=24.34 TRINITY_DN11928_c0_g1_i1:272-853(+)
MSLAKSSSFHFDPIATVVQVDFPGGTANRRRTPPSDAAYASSALSSGGPRGPGKQTKAVASQRPRHCEHNFTKPPMPSGVPNVENQTVQSLVVDGDRKATKADWQNVGSCTTGGGSGSSTARRPQDLCSTVTGIGCHSIEAARQDPSTRKERSTKGAFFTLCCPNSMVKSKASSIRTTGARTTPQADCGGYGM